MNVKFLLRTTKLLYGAQYKHYVHDDRATVSASITSNVSAIGIVVA